MTTQRRPRRLSTVERTQATHWARLYMRRVTAEAAAAAVEAAKNAVDEALEAEALSRPH